MRPASLSSKRAIATVAAVVAVALAACGRKADCPRCPEPSAAAGAPAGGTITLEAPTSPVQAEMRHLAAAMETAVRGVGTGDVSEVQHALHRVHEARQATEEAIHGGWQPARNADQLDTFVAMDEAFHVHLEKMAEASAANDVPATAAALAEAVKACDGCHTLFRASAAPAAPAAPSAPAAPAAPAEPHQH